MTEPLAVDRDEYGAPVSDRYRRLGANGDQEGLFVRFEPGFGLNVHIGFRYRRYPGDPLALTDPWIEKELGALGITGWERLGELVDEWRTREVVNDD
jgi:hypothetical protein